MRAALLISAVTVSIPANASDTLITLPSEPSASEAEIKRESPASATLEQSLSAYERGDLDTALSLAKRDAEAGDADAQLLSGRILSTENYSGRNDRQAKDWLEQAAAQNSLDAYMALGALALQSRANLTPSDALPWFSRAANRQRADAMRAIGEMYIHGEGIAQDLEKGRDWLIKSHNQGDRYAARKVADSYFDTDAEKALNWYEKAAKKGDFEAAYVASIMLAENLDVYPDGAKQARLMRQAAYAGHPAAMADYGLLVLQGAGTVQSNEEAAEWFRKSAQAGDSEGKFLYAYSLAKGEGVERSFEEAYYWLLSSGVSEVSAYQKDRDRLRDKLEANVDPAVLDRGRARYLSEQSVPDDYAASSDAASSDNVADLSRTDNTEKSREDIRD